MEKSKLLLLTFDAQLIELKIIPKCCHTKISYKLKIYDEALHQRVIRTMHFEDVAAIKFCINYFDNPMGAEMRGFYEIFQREKKEDILEKNFILRKNSVLFHNDYNYEPNDPYDLLNNRENIEHILKKIDDYHLLQQQTIGGDYFLLAKKWILE